MAEHTLAGVVLAIFITISSVHLVVVVGLPMVEDIVERLVGFRQRCEQRLKGEDIEPK